MKSKRLKERTFDAILASRGNVFMVYDDTQKAAPTVNCFTKKDTGRVTLESKKDFRLKGTRPYVVISDNSINSISSCVLACPIRTDHKGSSLINILNSGYKGVPFYTINKELCIIDTQSIVTLNQSQICNAMYLYSLPSTVMELIDNDIDFRRYGVDNIDSILNGVRTYEYDDTGNIYNIKYLSFNGGRQSTDSDSCCDNDNYEPKQQAQVTIKESNSETDVVIVKPTKTKTPSAKSEDNAKSKITLTSRHKRIKDISELVIKEEDKNIRVILVSNRGRAPFWGKFNMEQLKLMLIERKYLCLSEFSDKYKVNEKTSSTISFDAIKPRILNNKHLNELESYLK